MERFQNHHSIIVGRGCAALICAAVLLTACAGEKGGSSSQVLASSYASSQAVAEVSDPAESEVSSANTETSTNPGSPGSAVGSASKGSPSKVVSASTSSTVNKPPRKKGECIMIENNVHMDKVVTKGFVLPETTKESKSDYKIPVVLTNGCVLQAYKACRLWGEFSSDGGIAVRVTRDSDGKSSVFYGEVKNGEFELYIKVMEYGGPFTLTFIAENGKSCSLKNVLFGEVFICGGQSNMGWTMNQCYDGTTSKLLYQDIIDRSKDKWLCRMGVWPANSQTPVESLTSCAQWASASPAAVTGWNATAYFFGRRFREIAPDIPVGLVTSCMGATGIEQWMIGGEWNNGMINPIKNITARGVIWYQGEGDPENYSGRLAKMIGEWRSQFRDPGLLWAAVQLPRYINEEVFYKCREEVKKAKDLVDNYTYCVTIDTGLYPELKAEGDTLNNDGIHPYEKEPVGTRLADAMIGAFTETAGLWTAPYATGAKRDADGNVVVTFANVGGGLMLQGKAGFELFDEAGFSYDAEPILRSNNQIVLKCDTVSTPVKVRYGCKNQSIYTGIFSSCAESVCVYSKYPGNGRKAYPAEQFTFSVKK